MNTFDVKEIFKNIVINRGKRISTYDDMKDVVYQVKDYLEKMGCSKRVFDSIWFKEGEKMFSLMIGGETVIEIVKPGFEGEISNTLILSNYFSDNNSPGRPKKDQSLGGEENHS